MTYSTDLSIANLRGIELGEPDGRALEASRDRGDAAETPEPTFTDQPQALTAGSNMIEFDPSVGPEQRARITKAMLLAQLAANAQAGADDSEAYFNAYYGVLTQSFGVQGRVDNQTQDFTGRAADVQTAMLAVLQTALGGAGAASLIAQALSSLGKAAGSQPWMTLFSLGGSHKSFNSFQLCYGRLEQGQPVLKLLWFGVDASDTHGQVLFVKFANSSARLHYRTGELSFSDELLERTADIVDGKLRDRALDRISQIQLDPQAAAPPSAPASSTPTTPASSAPTSASAPSPAPSSQAPTAQPSPVRPAAPAAPPPAELPAAPPPLAAAAPKAAPAPPMAPRIAPAGAAPAQDLASAEPGPAPPGTSGSSGPGTAPAAAPSASPATASGSEPPPMKLSVVCGDVSFATYPVVVGHFAGDAISGVEKRLDESLADRLTRRYALGAYPSAVASASVVRNPHDEKAAGVVVGLGDVTSFTAATIRTALITGLTELALAGPSDNEGDVAIVPPGVSKGAVSLTTALGAILSAAADAQSRLESQGFKRFARISIIEQMEDEAHAIWHALDQLLQGASLGRAFSLAPHIDYKDGWARRVDRRLESDNWRAVQITGTAFQDGRQGLRFTSIGDMARAEGFTTGDTHSFVGLLMHTATRSAKADGEGVSSGRALFELTWPDALKRDSRADMPTRLILDEVAAYLPFELMDDRRIADPDLKPPAVRHGLLRQLIQQSFAADRNRAFGRRTALVIGDPRAGWPNPAPGVQAQFPPLPGAQEEAREVADLLRSLGYQVKDLIGVDADPATVIEWVLRGGWTIVHIASHGVYDTVFRADWEAAGKPTLADGRPDLTGLRRYTGAVLGDRVVLDSAVLQSMPDAPALAFINCCNLGAIIDDDERRARLGGAPEFAASFAAEMMAVGAHAVIAAGWSVNDAGAQTFATEFYRQMLGFGAGYGDAVLRARAAVYARDPINTTWGAYQCYGEPDWRLPGPTPTEIDGGGPSSALRYASPAEVVAELQSLTNQAWVGGEGRVDRSEAIARRIEAIESSIEGAWLGPRPARPVAEALAFAHQALGHNQKAIALFEACLTARPDGRDPGPGLRLLEQLASLKVKVASAAAIAAAGGEAAEETRRQAMETIDQASQSLEGINCAAGATNERWALIGSFAKRRAQFSTGEERSKSLDRMADAYGKARETGQRLGARDLYYPSFLALNAAVVRRLSSGDLAGEVEQRLSGIAESDLRDAEAALGQSPDYWVEATRAGKLLLDKTVAGALSDADAAEVARAYNEAWQRSGDPHALAASAEHWDWIAEMLGDSAAAGWIREKVEPLLATATPRS